MNIIFLLIFLEQSSVFDNCFDNNCFGVTYISSMNEDRLDLFFISLFVITCISHIMDADDL